MGPPTIPPERNCLVEASTLHRSIAASQTLGPPAMTLQPLPPPWPVEPVRIPVGDLHTEISELLDEVDALSDPTLLDVFGEIASKVSRNAVFDRPPSKIDHHSIGAPEGHKSSIQASDGFCDLLSVHLAATGSTLPGGYLDLMVRLEELRRRIVICAAPYLGADDLLVGRQSIRAIRYRHGLHEPQRPHVDQAVRVAIVLPPRDDRLIVELPDGSRMRVRAFPTVATLVLIEGACVLRSGEATTGTPHLVQPLRRDAVTRDVATLFTYGSEPPES